jgi:hypothetical protein
VAGVQIRAKDNRFVIRHDDVLPLPPVQNGAVLKRAKGANYLLLQPELLAVVVSFCDAITFTVAMAANFDFKRAGL